MNSKAITKAMIAQERADLMWNWQSPTVPACNPHPPPRENHAPRLKGPYQPKPRNDTEVRKVRKVRKARKIYYRNGRIVIGANELDTRLCSIVSITWRT